MVNLLLSLHVLFAVFAIGPLVHAATTAGRGIRTGDAAATASAARMLKMYSYASVLVVLLGMGLMSMDDPDRKGHKIAQFGDTWVWLSLVLWVLAVALSLGVVVPSLTRATAVIGGGAAAGALTARVAAAGGVIGVVFAVIVFLMVYRPGG